MVLCRVGPARLRAALPKPTTPPTVVGYLLYLIADIGELHYTAVFTFRTFAGKP